MLVQHPLASATSRATAGADCIEMKIRSSTCLGYAWRIKERAAASEPGTVCLMMDLELNSLVQDETSADWADTALAERALDIGLQAQQQDQNSFCMDCV